MREDTVNYVTPWIWLTALVSLLLTAIVYFAARKRIDVQYYLCPKCADKRKIRVLSSSAVAAVSVIGLGAGLFIGDFSLFSTFLASFAASTVGLAIFGRAPLRAIAHHKGYFSLKGASRELLESIERKQLTED